MHNDGDDLAGVLVMGEVEGEANGWMGISESVSSRTNPPFISTESPT